MRLGVDFGTSHTVAVLAYPDGRTKSMLFDDGTPLLRSAVYADSDGTIQVGRDAVRRAGLDPTRYEPNPKQRIDESTVLLGDSEHRVVDLFGAVLQRVVSEVRRVAGSIPQDVVMTYPAAWGARRREILTNAAASAGLHNVRTIPEPVGAAVYFTTVLGHSVADGRPLGVFDFGGGTLDVAVVRRDGNTFTVLSSGGLSDLGGVDLDSALVDHLGQLIAQRDPALWNRLANPQNSNDRRSRQLLWDDVRGAKESLSRTTSAPVNVPETDSDLHLTRDEFERLTTPLLQRAINETQRVIREARCEPSQLNGLFLVGGSSRVPLVARMLHSGLGIAPTVLEQPEVAVAEGAAKLGAAKGGPGTPPSSNSPMSAPSPMSNSPMSGPPLSGAPMSAPPMPPRPMSAPPAPRTNAPMSGPPSHAPARPISAAPMSPAPMSPAPMHQPRPPAYTPPPQPTYPPRQQAYSPPPPRQPVLPPVQHRPAPPPPQPQVVQVPYAVPVPVAPQPVAVPRKRSHTGKIIAAIIVAVIGLCCYGVVFKPAITAGVFDDLFATGPTMHGTVPSGMKSVYEPWEDALDECWANSPNTWGPTTSDVDALVPKISTNANSVYCTFNSDTQSKYYASSILFVDAGGKDLVSDAKKEYSLDQAFQGSGKAGGEFPAYAAIDGSGISAANFSDEFAIVIAGDSYSSVSNLENLYTKYAAS